MKTYKEVADACKMQEPIRSRYLVYMRTRWAEEEELQCQTGYAREWAERFSAGREYESSDGEGQGILKNMEGWHGYRSITEKRT